MCEKFFGAGRVPVHGTINGYPFRSTLAPYAQVWYLPVNRALRAGAKVKAGDTVKVIIERDDKARVVRTPPDLAQALKTNADARAAWNKLSFTHKREYAEAIRGAKKPETRARRVEHTIQMLVKKKR